MKPGPGPDQPLWLWSRMSSSKWEDAWEERLRFLPPGACAFLTIPGSRSLRIRAYTDEKNGKKLVRYFGGRLRRLEKAEWNRQVDRELTPLRVRGRLIVFSEESRWKAHSKAGAKPPGIWVPATMAFGTGSHPTTAGCLRLLSDEADIRKGTDWRIADLGTGSGILAIAAGKLGALQVEALDYDPVCIRTAKQNAKANRVRLDKCERMDVLQWAPKRPFQVITANLFSDTLIASAPRLSAALAPDGALIFSGVLRDQLGKVKTSFSKNGLVLSWTNARGKWVFGLCRRH